VVGVELFKETTMARKLSKRTISGLMAWWGRKGGSRATEAQKNAARANLKKTPNYHKHAQLAEDRAAENHITQGERPGGQNPGSAITDPPL
jgi:hypothetical protein